MILLRNNIRILQAVVTTMCNRFPAEEMSLGKSVNAFALTEILILSCAWIVMAPVNYIISNASFNSNHPSGVFSKHLKRTLHSHFLTCKVGYFCYHTLALIEQGLTAVNLGITLYVERFMSRQRNCPRSLFKLRYVRLAVPYWRFPLPNKACMCCLETIGLWMIFFKIKDFYQINPSISSLPLLTEAEERPNVIEGLVTILNLEK